ncbi:PREDICTED: epidermal growth factor receptor substrate 15-like isoform X2 [Tarenaya hassleriana]|uniref:epidermal growth factor receptor substrate 15-like isoform X2 n=1 Tax=Tarenaya hassleriana TaxID=28532 RepID=UPI00053C7EC3|nr:PREDICTED: epidermal growth factor receptor substrate 15-like isoform X2 [Tarenaya hassleriana]
MAGQNPSMDQFEAYFRRADLDGDGRISGAEAVGFFQRSGLPKQVLAQIWSYADRSRSGFLGRQDFFNALRLVTVAQSKRDLTPEIVNAALNTPAAAKIPPPKIDLSAIAGQQPNPVATAPQISPVSSAPTQNLGFRGPGAPNASVNHNYFPPQQNQMLRPTQGMLGLSTPRPSPGPAGPEYRASPVPGQLQSLPGGTVSRPPPQGVSTSVFGSNVSNDWNAGKTGGYSSGFGGVGLAGPSAISRPELPISTSLQPTAADSKALAVSGNGTAPSSGFGGDIFSATSYQQKHESAVGYSTNSSSIVPASVVAQPSPRPSALDSLQSNFSMLPAGNQLQHPRSVASSQSIMSSQGSSTVLPPGSSVGSGHSTPTGNSQPPWPKMKPSDVQKYTKVFVEVDSDKDGKITGEQARNLFLSWKLPRDVLKHVWELSDQDNDTMLSLREFCIALYLMERYRDGRPLPTALPQSVMFDETLLSISGPPNLSYANAGWGSGQGFVQQPGMGARPITQPTGARPQVPGPAPHPGSGIESNQERTQVPDLGDPFANHLGDGNSVSSKLPEVEAEGEKVGLKQNVIMDSREKLEYYRMKMQDIVLYKSRCDNRLNEITERACADKREAETLAKKYEEKYKQVSEIGSKLTIEEARFREIQERKTELRQAIINMEQGGSADGLLQVRADRIQSDLEELMKALSERCKKHGLDIKSKALVELPAGWQPGIQEGAALWDEEWDKFEDEGFGNELTFNKSKQHENGSLDDDSLTHDSSSHPDAKNGHFSDGEYAATHSDDESSRSPRGSPGSKTAVETSSPGYSQGKSAESDAESHRFFDDSNWASAFDTNDDVDSVWGLNASKSQDGDFFGSSGNFDTNLGRGDSPSSESVAQRKSPFVFDDSVPSTPLSRFGNSPPRFSDASARDNNFDNSFSRFDSFNTTSEMGFSSQPERFSRFDSISSSKDFGESLSRFDSINSSRGFGADKFSRSDSINSNRDFGGHLLSRFDSISSSKDVGGSHGYSFDDADPFGSSGPFRVSSEDKSPRKRSDNWNSF